MGVMAHSVLKHNGTSRRPTTFSSYPLLVVSITRRFKNYHNIDDVLQQMQLSGRQERERVMVRQAYEFAKEKHSGQTRADEETPVLYHLLEVAHKVASWGYNSIAVSAALLHDAPEDANVRLFEIQMRFGQTVAYLVGLLAKPKLHQGAWIDATSPKYYEIKGERGRELYDQKSEAYYNRLFDGGSLTALAIKFADSSQNLEEILNLPQWKRTRNVGTMVKHLVKLGERIMPLRAFNEFVTQLRVLGFYVEDRAKEEPSGPVLLLPSRRYVGRASLDKFQAPDFDHVTLYDSDDKVVFELGLPPLAARLNERVLLLALRAVFGERRFEVSRGESLLPSKMVGHEEIFCIRPTDTHNVPLDEISNRSTEFLFRQLRPLLEAASF